MGMFIAFMQCAILSLWDLSQPISWFILLIAGCGLMIGQLKEVRQRQTLINASAVAAMSVLQSGTLFLGLAEVPDLSVAWEQVLTNAIVAGASALDRWILCTSVFFQVSKVFLTLQPG